MENILKQDVDIAIKDAIIRTVAFFDMFDYPLTSWEIWKYLFDEKGSGEQIELKKILEKLESAEMQKILEQKESFYFLAGKDDLVETRKARYNFTDKKFDRAIRLCKIYKLIPWIKLIGVVNSYGSQNMKEEGDIDLFIITATDRIWSVRFFCVLVTKLLGLRPQKNNKKNKICLSFYVSEDRLDLSDLMLPKTAEIKIDIVLIYWFCGLTPIYDPCNIYSKFNQENEWRKNYLPNWQPISSAYVNRNSKALPLFYYKAVDFCFGWLEVSFKKLQHSLMANELRKMMNLDTRVMINDQILKLHSNDKREEYNKKHELLFRNIINSDTNV
ncbi:MAG: hypothetical protein US81_C0002G0027 [Parcubacteria group bacterium GW2011_GWE2_38_18]|nr:MAG: hypothetical protein US81_C0002G0027 [Parcubacteria group bacterium GW2011_GWE2_38_18]